MEKMDVYIDWLFKRRNGGGKKHSLEKIKRLLEPFDNPQDKLKIFHVAGTNGKGSVCNYLAKTLSFVGSCGLFTSPYMTCINEAVTINGENISDEDFCSCIDRLRPVVEALDEEGLHNSYFEVLTAIAYLYFYDKGVDFAVIEVGMGGTLDCTNIMKKPLASVISTISYDHMGILGNSLGEIAENKAGIIKKGVPVFVYPQEEEAMEVIRKKAEKEEAPLFSFRPDEVDTLSTGEGGTRFSFRDYKNVDLSLLGDYQVYNAALALMVLDYFKEELDLSEDFIRRGLFEAKNPGRLQIISRRPTILLDGCHNRQAIDGLIRALDNFSYKKLILGFTVLEDKEYQYIIERLSKITDQVVVTTVDNPRALDIDELAKDFEKFGRKVYKISDYREAFEFSKTLAGPEDLVLWCGSLYLVGEILAYLKDKGTYDL